MKITIEGDPVAKTRHRCRCIGGHPSAFDPQATGIMPRVRQIMRREYKKLLESKNEEIKLEAIRIAQERSLVVRWTFLLKVADSASNAQKNLKFWHIWPATQKPDFDNMIKLYSDCANGVLWTDDKIIVSGGFSKNFDEFPRTEIEIVSKKEYMAQPIIENVFKAFSPSQLEKFIKDCDQLVRNIGPFIRYHLDDSIHMDREEFLITTASLMSAFSTNYGDMLKKIQKVNILTPTETIDHIKQGHLKA